MRNDEKIDIGAMRRDEIPEVARLHHRWFGPGNELEVEGASLAMLGPEFLAEALYATNFDNPGMHVHVARAGGRIVAFNVFLSSRRGIGKHAILHHFHRLLRATVRALANRPRAIYDLLANLRYLSGEATPWLRDDDAQWLVFTVEPAYRSQEFVRRTGQRVTAAMFDAMEAELRARGCPAWYGTVWVSNRPMSRFMERIGATIAGVADAQGHSVNYWRKQL